jgi:hypothetical protein
MDKVPFSIYDFFGYLSSGFVTLAGLAAAFVGSNDWQKTPGTTVALLLIVLAYTVGHIVANVSGYVLEAVFVREVLGTPTHNLFTERPLTGIRRLLPGYYRLLPKEQRDRVLTKARERAQIGSVGEGLFYHCFAVVKGEEVVLNRLNTFLNLYGFCRNVAMALLIVSPALVLGTIVGSAQTGSLVSPGWWAAAAVIGAVGLVYRYLKFFRHYGVEVFTSYAEVA